MVLMEVEFTTKLADRFLHVELGLKTPDKVQKPTDRFQRKGKIYVFLMMISYYITLGRDVRETSKFYSCVEK